MAEFRKLEDTVEADGVKIEKYRFVEKRLITRGIPTAEGGFHYVAEATAVFQLCIKLSGGSVLLEPGALQYMPGKIETTVQRRSEEHTSELQSLMRISYAVLSFNTTNSDQSQY